MPDNDYILYMGEEGRGGEGHFENNPKQEMLLYVTDAPEGPLCATHLLIMLYLSVMFR